MFIVYKWNSPERPQCPLHHAIEYDTVLNSQNANRNSTGLNINKPRLDAERIENKSGL
jgi:CRISPR/Cas system type I-B associated protein Csh2 (Cas7 group RAMP superfamily)